MKAEVAGMPGTDAYWNTGKQYPKVYRTHLARIPDTAGGATSCRLPTSDQQWVDPSRHIQNNVKKQSRVQEVLGPVLVQDRA